MDSNPNPNKAQGIVHVNPYLIINLGGEMVFILDQRLRSQNVSPEKSQKVLQDIIKEMFSDKYVNEVFKPQHMYTLIETRQIFVKLAHSSIMRLNESSMQKLFDLMLMGFKLQTVQSCYPEEIFYVTLQHLNVMQSMIDKNCPAQGMLNKVR